MSRPILLFALVLAACAGPSAAAPAAAPAAVVSAVPADGTQELTIEVRDLI